MEEHGLVAGSPRPVVSRSRGAKTPGGGKQSGPKTVRQQLHLGETTVKRLNVHCSLVGRNASKTADEILLGWLARFGKGRELFAPPAPGDSTDPAESVG